MEVTVPTGSLGNPGTGFAGLQQHLRIDFSVSICLITYGMCTEVILQILSEFIYASVLCSW